jgi:hypothetical protein
VIVSTVLVRGDGFLVEDVHCRGARRGFDNGLLGGN